MNRKTIQHCMTTIIIFLIILCLVCGCGRISVSEATQARIDEEATHAEEDAMQYLSEKYDMEFELQSFEPDIFSLTSDANWFVRSHYIGAWEGEFIVDGETYTIRGDISENRYMDDYQFEEIQAAYTELIQQYFADVCNLDGVECEVDVRRDWSSNHYSLKRFFSVYYDGTNIDDCLKENGVWIDIDITNAGFRKDFLSLCKDRIDIDIINAGYSEEFLSLCKNSLANLEKDYEGAKFSICIVEGEKIKGIYTESEN